VFTQRHGRLIATKLSAKEERGRRHDLQLIYHNDKLITQYGIRRGSGDLPHGHIPAQLFISPNQCKKLSDCTLSAEQYFGMLRDKGKLS
jgi:hypothetical protein